jgi:hypothetical protein
MYNGCSHSDLVIYKKLQWDEPRCRNLHLNIQQKIRDKSPNLNWIDDHCVLYLKHEIWTTSKNESYKLAINHDDKRNHHLLSNRNEHNLN